jgi:hypothetical protein
VADHSQFLHHEKTRDQPDSSPILLAEIGTVSAETSSPPVLSLAAKLE